MRTPEPRKLKVNLAPAPDHLINHHKESPMHHNHKIKEAEYFKFVVGRGNNDSVVRRVMKKRYWFKETYEHNTLFNFAWQPTNRGIYFERLTASRTSKQVVNHFEFHREISTKISLIKNL
mmetsp:Transcript_13777/g.11730  ORF Transcript_13777/g.11730 Transcript_13777/m.11730 type:complete len:120 (-) Transcript_13777:882-1241(-)